MVTFDYDALDTTVEMGCKRMVRARLLGRLTIAVAAVAAVAVIPATASMAASGHESHPVAAVNRAETARHASSAVSGPGAYNACWDIEVYGVRGYCGFKGLDGADVCVDEVTALPNWNELDCRNLDESFANVSGDPVRVYYSPNFEGAWACVNSGWYSNDLNKDVYTFNNGGNGDAGYGQEIWENIASSAQASGGTCGNPLPEDG